MAITFGGAGHLELMLVLQSVQPAIGARARREVTREPARTTVREAVHSGRLAVKAVDLSNEKEVKALARFDAEPGFRGRGDAEVLALAVRHRYLVGTDDRAMRAAAAKVVGLTRLVSTLDTLVWARRESRLSATQAKRILRELDIGPEIARRLKQAGKTLEDLA